MLVLGSTSGFDLLTERTRGFSLRPNHPNPHTGRTFAELTLIDGGPVTMGVTDAMGREEARWQGSLAQGTHRFEFVGGRGTRLLWAMVNGQRSAIRMVGVSGDGPADLSYTGMGGTAPLRSLSSWVPGDELEMIGHATLNGMSILSGPLTDAPLVSDTITFDLAGGSICTDAGMVLDIDGNEYSVVTIGSQCWMAANLRTTRYRNGDIIPNVMDGNAWSGTNTGAWCEYLNDANLGNTFGKLYNWYAVIDPRGACPMGWHVPSDSEWTQLTDHLGGEAVAGGAMKAISPLWYAPNEGATNSSGFSGLPGGLRFGLGNGNFDLDAQTGFWWSASEEGATNSWARLLGFSHESIIRIYDQKRNGFSVRCIMD